MEKLEARKAELAELLANAEEPPPLIHPNMAYVFHQRPALLYEQLQREETKAQAAESLRTLVDYIELVPEGGTLAIVLRGNLAAILTFASGEKNPDFLKETEALEGLLAGTARNGGAETLPEGGGGGFEPATFRL